MYSAIFKTFFLSLCILANTHLAMAQTASLLPNAKQQFLDNSGKPLSSGTVDFYIPSTTTRKTTWQNAAETIANTNPVVLDAGGRAIILGEGSYRQVVKDRNGNIIWDQVTSSTGSGSSGSTATGDGDLVGTIKPWAGMTAPNQYAFTYGQEVSRTTYATLYTAITSSQATFCNSGSPILTGLTDTTNFWVGMSLEVSCVAATFSTVISKTSTTVTMAANANVTTNTTATFYPWGRGNGTTTFNLPDFRGVPIAGNNNMGGVASSNLTTTYFGVTNPNSAGALGGSQSKVLLTANLPPYTPTGIMSSFTGYSGNAGGATPGATGIIPASGPALTTLTFTGTAQGGTSTAFSIVQPTRTSNYIIKITPDSNSATASGVTSLGGMTGSIACGTGLLCTGNTISVDIVITTDLVRTANRASLKALNTGAIKTAFMAETIGRQGFFNWQAGNYSAAIAADTNEGVYIPSNADPTAATGAWVRTFDFINYYSQWFGTVNDHSTDNTTIINTIINVTDIPNTNLSPGMQSAAYIIVEGGVRFASTGLSFLPSTGHVFTYVRFFANSNTTKGVSSGGGGSNEWYEISVNSGYPGDPTGAMVAEWSFQSPLQPAMSMNVTKNMSGSDAHFNCSVALVDGQCLGTGQTRIPTTSIPTRSSYNLLDENVLRWRSVYEGYDGLNTFTTTRMQTFLQTTSIAGQAGFTSTAWCGGACVPVIGDTVIGATSKARGYLYRTPGVPTPDVMDMVWVSGNFIDGEAVTVGANTSTAVILGAGVSTATTPNASMWFGINTPAITIDVPPGKAQAAFTVGGRLAFTKSSGLENQVETVTNPAAMWCEGVASSTACIQARYSTVPAEANRRLEVVKGNSQSTTPNAWLTGPTLSVSFANAATANTSAYGVTSVARSGAGDYLITLNHTLARADPVCTTGKTNAADFIEIGTMTTTTIQVISRNGAGAATDLVGRANIVCFGGDI